MAYGDDVMKAIRGTVLDGRPRIGGVGDAEASARARRAAALSAAADYARSGRGGQGDSDMHLERAAEEALSQAMFAGIMAYGKSALALGRHTLADQLARRRASSASVLRRTRYQGGPFGEGVETLSDVALKPSTLTGARPAGRLGEVAAVSEEYSRAYPGIERDVVVNVVPDNAWAGYVEAAKRAQAEWAKTSDTSRGFFDRRLSAVSLRAQMPGETMEAYFDRADRTLVHELQHYAQMRDGLPATSPGSGYEWYRTAAREVDARNSANRLVLTPQERTEIPRSMTQDVKPEDVHMDDKGGDNFGTFRNFLARDEVPGSIFGYTVVQDESQYTEKDLEFFRKNPKAAGFYDLGDDEGDVETQEANGAGDTTDITVVSRLTEPDFDANSMAEQVVEELMSPRQALEMFYGSEVDRIMSEAEQARRSAALKRGLPEPDPIFDQDPRRISVVPLHEDVNEISRSSTLSSRMKAHGTPGAGEGPLDGAVAEPPSSGRVRSYASPLDGAAVIYKGHEDAWAHELLGHVLNPYQVTSKEQDRFGPESKFYHFGNYAETAAALGNLRKALFKKSAGKVDIADPAELKKVVGEYKTNKDAFSGKWLPKDARAFLEAAIAPHPASTLGNELLDKRIRATWEVMQDEKSLKQFVKTQRNNQNGLA